MFFLLVLVVTGCSNKSETDYLKSAEENLKSSKIQEAISDYETYIKEYPESEKAPETLTKLASIYQNSLIKNLSKKESLEKAVSVYREVYDKYPNSKQAPTSLFMSAFILANDLRKYHAAEVTYNLFLQKYPNHELASSAREELNNLGLSPEEILKKKSSKNI
jgi:TolA-binding protein